MCERLRENEPHEVLIVEDELLVALDLEDILTRSGYGVVGIVADKSGLGSLAVQPDVALVDLNLRDGATGNEVARQLAQCFGTRIVFVTANPAQITDPPATAVGLVQKPFRPESVINAVAAALGETDDGGAERSQGAGRLQVFR